MGGGTDTTHMLMDWVMAELIRKPKILEKLQDEVRQVIQGKSEVTEDDLPRMPYLKAVIKETSRLHCPLPLLVPRQSTQDINLMGYNISAGTQVIVNAWAIGRDPNIWDNPKEFQPERFLKSSIDFRGFHFELIPFGGGRRSCPGISFATVVTELALARLLHNFNFSLPDGVTPEDIDMTEAAGSINVSRKLPLLLVVSPYSS